VLDGYHGGVRQWIAAAVSQHVRVNWIVETGALTNAFYQPIDGIRTERGGPFTRLPLAPKHASKASSPVVTTLSRPPIGCESAFSLAADPKRSHIFGRCIS
jgi:hypothetical protein